MEYGIETKIGNVTRSFFPLQLIELVWREKFISWSELREKPFDLGIVDWKWSKQIYSIVI